MATGAVAGNDRDAAGRSQRRGGALDVGGIGCRAMRGNTPFLGIDERRFGGLAELDLIPLVPRKIEMGRAWRLRQGSAPGMTQQPRQFGGYVDGGRKFRHRGEERRVRNFLIRIAMLK